MRFGASVCLAGAAAPALADNVTLYGVVDSYIGAINSSGRTEKSVDSGGLQVSRFGLMGSEDLGGGTRAVFRLEGGFNTNNGNASVAGQMFGRQAWVGFANNDWGEFRIGKQNSVFFNMLGKIAAFYGGTFGAGLGTQSGYNFRNNNDISYSSPRWHGWRLETHYALGDSYRHSQAGRVWQAAIEYQNGPYYFLAAHVDNTLPGATDDLYDGTRNRQTAIGGSYDFDPVTVYLGYFKNEQTDGSIDKDLYSISVAFDLTAADQLSLGWTYIDVKADNANTDPSTFGGSSHANHYGIMYLHRLSKRTTLYAAGAWIDNGEGLRYAIGAAQAPSADWRNRPLAGDATRGVQFGIRHVF
nr:porin [Bordetella sp. BOR01]